MHKVLHPRDDVDRLYVFRIDRGRGLTSIEDSVDASIQRLEDYIRKHGGRLDYSPQKRYWQHNRRQNDNKLGIKNGKKNHSMGVLND